MNALVRTACLTHYREIALAAGLSPQRMLAEAGLSPDALRDPDLKVPVERVVRLLEESAARARDESFGLRMAESRQLSNLGPVGLLLRDQPTLRDSLDVLQRYHRTLNGALLYNANVSDVTASYNQIYGVRGGRADKGTRWNRYRAVCDSATSASPAGGPL